MLIIVQDFKEAELGGLLHNINRGMSQEEFQGIGDCVHIVQRNLRNHRDHQMTCHG